MAMKVNELKKYIERCVSGVSVVNVEYTKGAHLRIHFKNEEGIEGSVVATNTCTDKGNRRNFIVSDIKRYIKRKSS